MSPPHVRAPSGARRNTRSSARVTQTRTQHIPIVIDVDEINTPEYDPHTTQVVEERNPSQEARHSEEEVETKTSDGSRGKEPQQCDQTIDSLQQGLDPEEEHETENQSVPEVRGSSPQGKKKVQAKSSPQGISCTQMKLAIVIPKIPKGLKAVDEMVGGVHTMKYFDHGVADIVKFPDLVQPNYMESRGEGPSGAPLLEPMQWILGLYNTWIMNFLDIPHFGCSKHINGCVKQLLARVQGGILWMDRPVPINFDLIATITGLPTDGEKTK
jgi:hypothetical protein